MSIKQELHYGCKVWVNTTMDYLRKTECLCLNCEAMSGCETAKRLYEICKSTNVAMAITRCPLWIKK